MSVSNESVPEYLERCIDIAAIETRRLWFVDTAVPAWYSLTYRDIQTKSNSVAMSLTLVGFRNGDVVMHFVEHSPHLPLVYLAAWKCGGIVRGHSNRASSHEVRNMMEGLSVKVVVVDQKSIHAVKRALPSNSRMTLVGTDQITDVTPLANFLETHVPKVHPFPVNQLSTEEDTGVIFNSDRLLRGAMYTQRTLVRWLQTAIKNRSTMGPILTMERHYDMVFLLLFLDATQRGETFVYLSQRNEYAMLSSLINKYKITQLALPRYDFRCMIKHYGMEFEMSAGQIKLLRSTDTNLCAATIHKLFHLCPDAVIIMNYSTIEALFVTQITLTNDVEHQSVEHWKKQFIENNVGYLWRTVEAKINKIGKIKNVGVLLIKSPFTMSGYVNDDLVRMRDKDYVFKDNEGWLHTNDIFLSKTKLLFYLNRGTDCFLMENEVVCPGVIEAELKTRSEISDAVVVAIPHRQPGIANNVAAVIVPTSVAAARTHSLAYWEEIIDNTSKMHKIKGGLRLVRNMPSSGRMKQVDRGMVKRFAESVTTEESVLMGNLEPEKVDWKEFAETKLDAQMSAATLVIERRVHETMDTQVNFGSWRSHKGTDCTEVITETVDQSVVVSTSNDNRRQLPQTLKPATRSNAKIIASVETQWSESRVSKSIQLFLPDGGKSVGMQSLETATSTPIAVRQGERLSNYFELVPGIPSFNPIDFELLRKSLAWLRDMTYQKFRMNEPTLPLEPPCITEPVSESKEREIGGSSKEKNTEKKIMESSENPDILVPVYQLPGGIFIKVSDLIEKLQLFKRDVLPGIPEPPSSRTSHRDHVHKQYTPRKGDAPLASKSNPEQEDNRSFVTARVAPDTESAARGLGSRPFHKITADEREKESYRKCIEWIENADFMSHPLEEMKVEYVPPADSVSETSTPNIVEDKTICSPKPLQTEQVLEVAVNTEDWYPCYYPENLPSSIKFLSMLLYGDVHRRDNDSDYSNREESSTTQSLSEIDEQSDEKQTEEADVGSVEENIQSTPSKSIESSKHVGDGSERGDSEPKSAEKKISGKQTVVLNKHVEELKEPEEKRRRDDKTGDFSNRREGGEHSLEIEVPKKMHEQIAVEKEKVIERNALTGDGIESDGDGIEGSVELETGKIVAKREEQGKEKEKPPDGEESGERLHKTEKQRQEPPPSITIDGELAKLVVIREKFAELLKDPERRIPPVVPEYDKPVKRRTTPKSYWDVGVLDRGFIGSPIETSSSGSLEGSKRRIKKPVAGNLNEKKETGRSEAKERQKPDPSIPSTSKGAVPKRKEIQPQLPKPRYKGKRKGLPIRKKPARGLPSRHLQEEDNNLLNEWQTIVAELMEQATLRRARQKEAEKRDAEKLIDVEQNNEPVYELVDLSVSPPKRETTRDSPRRGRRNLRIEGFADLTNQNVQRPTGWPQPMWSPLLPTKLPQNDPDRDLIQLSPAAVMPRTDRPPKTNPAEERESAVFENEFFRHRHFQPDPQTTADTWVTDSDVQGFTNDLTVTTEPGDLINFGVFEKRNEVFGFEDNFVDNPYVEPQVAGTTEESQNRFENDFVMNQPNPLSPNTAEDSAAAEGLEPNNDVERLPKIAKGDTTAGGGVVNDDKVEDKTK